MSSMSSSIVIQSNPTYDESTTSTPEQQQQSHEGILQKHEEDHQEDDEEEEEERRSSITVGNDNDDEPDWDGDGFPFPKESKRIVVPRLSVSSPCGTTRNELLFASRADAHRRLSSSADTSEDTVTSGGGARIRRSSSPAAATNGLYHQQQPLGARPKIRRATMGLITRVSPVPASAEPNSSVDEENEIVTVSEEAMLSVYDNDEEAVNRRTSDVSLYQQQKRVRLSIPCEPCISSSTTPNSLTVPGEVIGGGGGGATIPVVGENGETMWADPRTRFKRRSAVHGLSPNSGLSIGAVM